MGLPKGHIWAGGGSVLQDGTPFFANMPTEEIFCSPHRERADGVVYSSMPLCCNGEMVEDFSFTFRDGKIVDYTARVGKEVLARLLETDEGAIRLGECALIPKESPIAGTGLIFYNTLFDENAACHLALGAGFSECLEGGLEMDDDQLKAHGVNCSAVHLDFMFGTSDLSVTGIRQDGTEVPIFRNGSWVTEKKPFRFRREIDGWESWGKVFQDLEGFTPLALSILAAQGFPAEPLQLLTPGTNGVFRSGNQVIKLFAPIESGLDTLADWKVEKLLLEKAAELGVQAPRLLAAGACQDRYLFRYLILSYCSGQEAGGVLSAMTDGEKQDFAVRLRTLLDRLHQPLAEPVLERDLVGQVMQNPRLRLVAPSLAEELRRRAASISLSPLVLVHGDCTGENLLVEEDGSLTLIDFADSCLAPACYELPPVVFGLFSGDPVLVRAFRGDLSPDVFLDQLVDGLSLHDFAGNILSEYLEAQHIPVQEVESLEQLRNLLRQRLI